MEKAKPTRNKFFGKTNPHFTAGYLAGLGLAIFFFASLNSRGSANSRFLIVFGIAIWIAGLIYEAKLSDPAKKPTSGKK